MEIVSLMSEATRISMLKPETSLDPGIGDPSREGSPERVAGAMQDYDASPLPRTARGSRPEPPIRTTRFVPRRARRCSRDRGCRARRYLGALRDTRDERTPARCQRPPARNGTFRDAAAER